MEDSHLALALFPVSPLLFSFSLLPVSVSTVSPALRGVLSSIGIARAEQETGIPTAPFHVAMPAETRARNDFGFSRRSFALSLRQPLVS